jgi:ABC-type nitrate/sulfonate/bicarbonate transport system substrate-binding protein
MLRQSMRPRTALTLLLAVALLLAGCGGGDGGGQSSQSEEDPDTPPEEPVTIRMGWVPQVPGGEQDSMLVANPDLMPNLGTWYEVEYTDFPGTPEIVQGLAGGTLDAGTVGSLTAASGLAQGAEFVLTASHLHEHPDWAQTVWLSRTDSGIAAAADVAGKTVAVNQTGAIVDYVADNYLREEAELEPGRDYDKVEVPFPQMQDAIASGQADLGVFPEVPFGGIALSTGDFQPLFRATDLLGEHIIILQAFSREFVDEHPVVAQKFTEDYRDLARYMDDPEHRQEAIDAYAQITERPPEQIDAYLLTERDYFRPPDRAIDVELLQTSWDFFREQGAFDARLEVEDYIVEDVSILPEQG